MTVQFYCAETKQTMRATTCYKCNTHFAMSETVYRLAQERKGDLAFYCPNGHGQVYAEGESQLDKMRRERDRLAQQIAQKDDEITAERLLRQAAERQASASKAQVTRLKTRAGAGVCPCCNRTFSGLARHMSAKHPNFKAEQVA